MGFWLCPLPPHNSTAWSLQNGHEQPQLPQPKQKPMQKLGVFPLPRWLGDWMWIASSLPLLYTTTTTMYIITPTDGIRCSPQLVTFTTTISIIMPRCFPMPPPLMYQP